MAIVGVAHPHSKSSLHTHTLGPLVTIVGVAHPPLSRRCAHPRPSRGHRRRGAPSSKSSLHTHTLGPLVAIVGVAHPHSKSSLHFKMRAYPSHRGLLVAPWEGAHCSGVLSAFQLRS